MKKRHSIPFHAMLLAGFTLLFSSLSGVVFAEPGTQTSTNFSATRIENRFPVAITFSTLVKSTATIEKAQFFFYTRNSPSITRVDLERSPAREMYLKHTWDTTKQTIAPSTPIFYYWQVTLKNGEVIKTEEALIYYDDTRFDWQVREKNMLSVWWHDRPADFGEKSFEIALKAFNQQQKLFRVGLDYPIRIIIYNNKEEFAAWYYENVEFIGGTAFPKLGITAQIVNDNERQDSWLNEVIPHEISHLYFCQGTYHAIAKPPQWLDEGVAQYNEFTDQYWAKNNARIAILSGDYVPLKGLTYGFGYEEEKFRLAYDESISAVSFLIERYGENRLVNLMAAYKNGQLTSEAFPSALGVTFENFEMEWLASLGVPDGKYPLPPDQITPPPSQTFGQDSATLFLLAAGLLIGVPAYCFMIGLVVVVGVILLQKSDKQKQ